MSDKLRVKLAALVTALFLAATCAAGLIAHTQAPVQPSRHVASAQRVAPSRPDFSSPPHEPDHD